MRNIHSLTNRITLGAIEINRRRMRKYLYMYGNKCREKINKSRIDTRKQFTTLVYDCVRSPFVISDANNR